MSDFTLLRFGHDMSDTARNFFDKGEVVQAFIDYENTDEDRTSYYIYCAKIKRRISIHKTHDHTFFCLYSILEFVNNGPEWDLYKILYS